MRFRLHRKTLTALSLGCLLAWSAGCASAPPVAVPPAKPPVTVHAMVDTQKLMEAHPSRSKLRQMEQALAEADAKAADNTTAMETGRQEFEAAMKVRENEDKAAIEEKTNTLMSTSQKLGEKMYADAQAAAGAAAGAGAADSQAQGAAHQAQGGGAKPADDDNVVDAEVKEVRKG